MHDVRDYLIPSQVEALTSTNPQAEIDSAPIGSKISYRVLGIIDENDQLSEAGLELIRELRKNGGN